MGVSVVARLRTPGLVALAGIPFWPASLLPAVVGTTLPFWLRPPGFAFRSAAAAEFLAATVLTHAGFSLLQAGVRSKGPAGRRGAWLLTAAGACLAVAAFTILHLSRLVPGDALLVYGVSVLFTGVLYVVPPLDFGRRVGREIVLCEALGLLPVLGAYLVQTGDLTRTVYLAALPLFVATGLWVWMDELISRDDDVAAGRGSLVVLFGTRLSGRVGAPGLLLLFCGTLAVAVGSRALSPLALVALGSLSFAPAIVRASWRGYDRPADLLRVRRRVSALYLSTGIVVGACPLIPVHAW